MERKPPAELYATPALTRRRPARQRSGASVQGETGRASVEEAEAAVRDLVSEPLLQNEFDALVSLVVDLGPDALSSSPLLARLNSGDHQAAGRLFTGSGRGRSARRLARARNVDPLFAMFGERPDYAPEPETSFELTRNRIREALHFQGVQYKRAWKGGVMVSAVDLEAERRMRSNAPEPPAVEQDRSETLEELERLRAELAELKGAALDPAAPMAPAWMQEMMRDGESIAAARDRLTDEFKRELNHLTNQRLGGYRVDQERLDELTALLEKLARMGDRSE